MMFHALVLLVAFAAGGIASIAGFGIGSLLTPVLAASVGTKAAVAVSSRFRISAAPFSGSFSCGGTSIAPCC